MNATSTFSLSVPAILLLSIGSAACSGDPSSACVNTATAPGAEVPGDSAATSTNTLDIAALEAACTTNYDQMVARFNKCGDRATMGRHPYEASRHSYMKLCLVQGSRPGTGYTATFRQHCGDVMEQAACTDLDAIVEACWEPRGELARGLPCNTDDQCADGRCVLPPGAASGTSCGTCGLPVLKSLGDSCESDRDKCAPGSRCTQTASGKACTDDLGAESPKHMKPLGAACPKDTDYCVFGTYCDANKVCSVYPGDGETKSGIGMCDAWTVRTPTGKCIVPAPLQCD